MSLALSTPSGSKCASRWTRPATGWFGYEDALAASRADFAPPPLAPDHLAFLPYTSGSTGKPKGVALTHAGQCWWIGCLHKYWPMPTESRALAAVPLYHKNAMAGAIKPLLSAGGSVVLLPNFEPRRFLRALAGYRCTHAGGVPAVFSLLLQERELIESLDFSALKGLKIGSAPTPKELLDAVEAAFGVPASESYGLTEGGPVMIGPPLDGRPTPHGVAASPGRKARSSSSGRTDRNRRATANCGCATPESPPAIIACPR